MMCCNNNSSNSMDNCCIMLIFCRLLGHIIFNYILKFETILLNIHNSISINRSKHKTFEQFWPLLYNSYEINNLCIYKKSCEIK